MITVSTLFDAYLDINALLLFSCALCFMIALVLRVLGLSHTVTAQLHLMRAIFLAVIVSPLFAAAVALFEFAGQSPSVSLNLSDFVVAQYLQGRFDMEPKALEDLLGWRGRFTAEVTAVGGLFGAAVVAVLALGFLLFAARLAVSFLKLRRMIADSFVWRRFGGLELRLSDTITVPFSTRSLTRRYVILPSAMLGNYDDLKIALGHELQHLRQHDVEWEIGLEVLRPFLFWNPAFHLWKHRVERLRELSCDRRVMARRGYDVAAYCRCLLRVCHSSLKRPRLFSVEPPVVALVRIENRLFAERSADLLRGRLMSLIEGKAERHPRTVFALTVLPLMALTLMAAVAIQKPGDWSEDRIMLTTIVNLERIHAANGTAMFGSPGY